jgi:hypothetical protein
MLKYIISLKHSSIIFSLFLSVSANAEKVILMKRLANYAIPEFSLHQGSSGIGTVSPLSTFPILRSAGFSMTVFRILIGYFYAVPTGLVLLGSAT